MRDRAPAAPDRPLHGGRAWAAQAVALACLALAAASACGADAGAAARNAILANYFFKHFTIGQDAPAAWFNDSYATSGAAWDARVAYMSGGVGQGGTFPFFADMDGIGLPDGSHTSQMDAFIMDCQSVANGKQVIPWITFYNLAQSYPALYQDITKNPPTPNDPAAAAPYNAQVPSTMLAYYQLFKWVMQRCATYAPYPIVVHLEPDGWADILLAGPTTLDGSGINVYHPELDNVCVASSGMPELSDLPNNLIGYAKGLKRLRDMYAPDNVILCTNPSGWDSQYSMTGAKMGALWNEMCPDWDLADFEFTDRDQGCSGNPPFGSGNEGCGICGTYALSEQWISQFHAASGLYVLMWQVSVGNTYYTSCDQTTGHYCDNHIQHLLETYSTDTSFMDAYIASGCIGWMFNAGQGFQTHVYDEMNDGITDPAAFANTEGNTPLYADDDGGFARVFGGAYYANPRPITYTAPDPATDPEVLAGTVPTTSAAVSGSSSSSSSSSSSGCGLGGLSVALGLLALGGAGLARRVSRAR